MAHGVMEDVIGIVGSFRKDGLSSVSFLSNQSKRESWACQLWDEQ